MNCISMAYGIFTASRRRAGILILASSILWSSDMLAIGEADGSVETIRVVSQIGSRNTTRGIWHKRKERLPICSLEQREGRCAVVRERVSKSKYVLFFNRANTTDAVPSCKEPVRLIKIIRILI